MFVLKCKSDGSFCTVENHQVIFDEESVDIGSEVTFIWGMKSYKGVVVAYSDDEAFINKTFAECTKKKPKNMKVGKNNTSKKITSSKRKYPKESTAKSIINKRTFEIVNLNNHSSTVEEEEVEESDSEVEDTVARRKSRIAGKEKDIAAIKTIKKGLSKVSSPADFQETSSSMNDKGTSDEEISPFKSFNNRTENKPTSEDEDDPNNGQTYETTNSKNKKILLRPESTILSVASVNNINTVAETTPRRGTKKTKKLEDSGDAVDSGEDSSDDITIDLGLLSDDSQLFGKDFPNVEMFHIGSSIYCKKSILYEAVNAATNARQIARRLIPGIFKLEAILNITLTGKPYQARKKSDAKQESLVHPMHAVAKKTIINYALKLAKNKKLKPVMTVAEIKFGMTQKIGEIKRDYKESLEQNLDYNY